MSRDGLRGNHTVQAFHRLDRRDALRLCGLVALLAIFPISAAAQTAGNGKAATEYLQSAQGSLSQRRSIRAEITEMVSLTNPPFKMTGSYVSAGLKLRLEYSVKLAGGAVGALREVCDGERLWTLTEMPGAKRVTRRDVRQILAAVESHRLRPDRAAAVDLALGGLPALLSSLQRSMQFDAMKEEQLDGRMLVVIQGRWQPELRQKFVGGDGELPAHIPDVVRLYFSKETQFPERLLYLKQQPSKKYQPLLDLHFKNVILDGPVDEREFELTPPDDVEPEDITRQYLDQLFPPDAPTTQPR